MVDREKVLAVLKNRFPGAATGAIAAAANALVGLDEDEWEEVQPDELTTRAERLQEQDIRVYRRRG